jgi:hypothetical protein
MRTTRRPLQGEPEPFGTQTIENHSVGLRFAKDRFGDHWAVARRYDRLMQVEGLARRLARLGVEDVAPGRTDGLGAGFAMGARLFGDVGDLGGG